jgi:BirA family transcriptional regulator, biotin operon repressor / biotin---[acetyl-CoA-carboxylase] ligase
MTQASLTLPPGYKLLCYETLDSTNDEAKRLARAGAAANTVVWAREQTAGRGRRGRVWQSPRGNLSLSLILRPLGPPGRAAQLGFVAALALAEAVNSMIAPTIALCFKWPNDVLANGRKFAGILLESEMSAGGGLQFLVIGVGANLAVSPGIVEFPATSLAEEGAEAPAPGEILARFVGAFDHWARGWREEGFAPVRAAWLARALALGKAIRVRLEDRSLDGRFLDLDEDGALVLLAAGGACRIAAGEVFPAAG